MIDPLSKDAGASQTRLQSVFDGMPLGMLLLAESGEVLHANRRALELLGKEREGVVGEPFEGLLDDGGVIRRHLHDAPREQLAFDGVHASLRRQDGQLTSVEVALWRLADGSSAVSFREPQQGVARDRADLLLENVLEHSPAVVYLKDREGRLTRVNRQYERIFGFAPGEIIGRTEHELFPKEVADAWRKNDVAVMETRTPTKFEETAPHTDGMHWYVSVKFPLLDSDGQVVGIGGISTDISERKRAEEALKSTAEELKRVSRRFEAVVEVSPVPYALNDDQGNITYLNPAFVRTFGYDLADIPTLADWWPRAYPDEAYREWVASTWAERIEQARQTGTAFEPMELKIRAKDGTDRIVTASAAPLGDAFADTHLVLLYDVTRDRQLAAERRALEERLAEAERMESIGRLAGGVAHDNNNNLMVILAHAEAALDEVERGTNLYDDLVAIRTAARHAVEVVRQLLAHARRQPVAPQVIDVASAVRCTASLLERLIGEHIRLDVRTATDLWPVRIDPGQLEQLVTNLVVNSRDAIHDAGVIIIAVENMTVMADTLDAPGGATPGDYLVLAVTDNGVGMAPDVKAHIFEPFFTTKSVGQGTGLGLATVYGIIKQNEGFVAVESTPGQGSTISVLLPRYAGPGSGPALADTDSASTSRLGTVLLVEDEEPLLKIMTRELRQSGYQVLPASGPSEALRIASAHEGAIDAIVTDVVMPEMNGRQLADRLIASYPDAICVFVSGYTADVIASRGVLEPGVHFLEKPFTVAELDDKLRRLLAQRQRD